MPAMKEDYTAEQELLKRLRDERCGGNAAELARKLQKDATYVNRLLYPVGKKGRKGIGLEVMRAATEAFSLPPGYWHGADETGWPFSEALRKRVSELTPRKLLSMEVLMWGHLEEEPPQDVQERLRKARASIEKLTTAVGRHAQEVTKAGNGIRKV